MSISCVWSWVIDADALAAVMLSFSSLVSILALCSLGGRVGPARFSLVLAFLSGMFLLVCQDGMYVCAGQEGTVWLSCMFCLPRVSDPSCRLFFLFFLFWSSGLSTISLGLDGTHGMVGVG